MTKILRYSVLLMFLLIASRLYATGSPEVLENPDIVVEIDGMYCALCSDAVVKSFESHAAIEMVSADYKTGLAYATLVDRDVDIEELTEYMRTSLEELGYSLISVKRMETHG